MTYSLTVFIDGEWLPAAITDSLMHCAVLAGIVWHQLGAIGHCAPGGVV